MSKLYNALQANTVGKAAATSFIPSIIVNESVENSGTVDDLTVYSVEAKFLATVTWRTGLKDQPGSPVREAWRMIGEDVFGEFRPMIVEIRRALHQRDFRKAEEALRLLEETMFKP